MSDAITCVVAGMGFGGQTSATVLNAACWTALSDTPSDFNVFMIGHASDSALDMEFCNDVANVCPPIDEQPDKEPATMAAVKALMILHFTTRSSCVAKRIVMRPILNEKLG